MNNSELHNPLVSIIIVTYNSSRYVIDTLESAKIQSYKNIELIITDDGSTDKTIEKCRKWIEMNNGSFINTAIITSEINTGIAANANRGIKAAKGEWIKFIAGDDLLLENCIEDNLEYIRLTPDAKFVVSEMKIINSAGKETKNTPTIYDGFRKRYFNQSAKKQLKTYARLPVFLNSPSFFIQKTLIEKINYFDETFKIFEDICLIYRVNGIHEKIYHLNRQTVKYRIHEDAISRCTTNGIGDKRKKELILIFKKYRAKLLNKLNPLDQSVYFETWLNNSYKGFKGYRMTSILRKLSLFYWYLMFLNKIYNE